MHAPAQPPSALTSVMNTSRPGPTGLAPSGLQGGVNCRANVSVGTCWLSGNTLEVTTFQPPLMRVTLSMVVLTPAAAQQAGRMWADGR